MTPALVTLIALAVGARLGLAGVGAYRFWSNRSLPPARADHTLLPGPGAPLDDEGLVLPRPEPRAKEVAEKDPPFKGVFRADAKGAKRYPGLNVPEDFDEPALKEALRLVGLPIRDTENPSPPEVPGGSSVMLLPMPRSKVLKVIETQGIHLKDSPRSDDSDLRELLGYLRESDLICAWHGLEDSGGQQPAVQIQLSYEQALWWYSWLDWESRTLAARPSPEGLHSW